VNSISLTHLCRSSGPRLSTPQLRRLLLLDGLLALADGGGAGNGLAAEIRAVVALGGAVDNGRVGPNNPLASIPRFPSVSGSDVLAGGAAGGDGRLLDLGSGGVGLVGLLGQQSDTAVLAGLDTNGLTHHVSLTPFHLRSRVISSGNRSKERSYLVGDKTLILCPKLANCLQIQHKKTCLARVLVGQVERVAGERHTTGLLPLDEGGAGAACSPASVFVQPSNFANSASCFRAALTGNFPDQVGRKSGHFVGIRWICRLENRK
jgi:hypothetical protein